jgi:hypothetical protein
MSVPISVTGFSREDPGNGPYRTHAGLSQAFSEWRVTRPKGSDQRYGDKSAGSICRIESQGRGNEVFALNHDDIRRKKSFNDPFPFGTVRTKRSGRELPHD